MLILAAEGSGQGKLEVNGNSQPISYEYFVSREEDEGDEARHVRIRLHASRDWLLKQGFKGEAVLVRGNGSRVRVHRDGVLDVHATVCVTLEGSDDPSTDDDRPDAYAGMKH